MSPHPSPSFTDVVAARMSRRNVLLSGALAVAAAGLSASPASARVRTGTGPGGAGPDTAELGFTAVPAGDADAVTLPAGYTAQTLAPWGQPIRAGGPAWRKDGSGSAADQALQIGSHHSGTHFFPLHRGPEGSRRGMLVINHESADPALLHHDAGTGAPAGDRVAKELAAQGVSVLEVELTGRGSWRVLDSRRNARITGTSPVTFSGPVGADHPALRTGRPAAGTLSNSGYGVTPWGTYLACEENTNAWFGTADPSWQPTRTQRRYGLSANGHGKRWHEADPRFDLAVNGNEPHRYGWVVEIDPFAAHRTPVKRTALGRFNHSSAAVTESGGRAVVYGGDDQDGGYLYKFVGDGPWKAHRSRGRSPLDHGTLHVARFGEDGTGRWLPLSHGQGPLTTALGWRDQADVLLRAREAADALGATSLDRPQQITVSPNSRDVYCALANGTGGHHPGQGSGSPRDTNPYGHVVRWREEDGAGAHDGFSWDVVVLGGDQAQGEGVLPGAGTFGSPKGLTFDAAGRLWIQTGISNHAVSQADHKDLGNNAVLVVAPRGEVRRFLTAPRGAEVTAAVLTPDMRTMFVSIQHPGERTAAWGEPTPENPRAVSDWPDRDPAGRPRSATVVVRRTDGGVIGAR
ncbi:PhoX family protein [Streptomyces venezuelae]|uniref:PhoX family protein n=1 Tax=Streptomyces venezuelae TaxID=54571 RepID=UPI00331BFB7D